MAPPENLDRKLPIELLHDIFSYLCIEDDHFSSIDQYHGPPDPHTSADFLLQVSSYWRHAALGYAPLFCVANWMSWSHKRLRLWAERGAAAGLAVFFLHYWPAREDDNEGQAVRDRFDLVKEYSDSWRAIILRVHHDSFPASHYNAASSLLQLETPCLRHLSIVQSNLDSSNNPLLQVSPSFAPLLETLHLRNVRIEPHSNWKHLLKADLAFPQTPGNNWPTVLTATGCTNLVLRNLGLEEGSFDLPAPQFDRLEHLALFLDEFRNTLSSPTIQAPNLRVLELTMPIGFRTPPWNADMVSSTASFTSVATICSKTWSLA